MKFEEIKVGDCLCDSNCLFVQILEKNTIKAECLVINFRNIYKDDYYADELSHFTPITEEKFKEILNSTCNFYINEGYKKWYNL